MTAKFVDKTRDGIPAALFLDLGLVFTSLLVPVFTCSLGSDNECTRRRPPRSLARDSRFTCFGISKLVNVFVGFSVLDLEFMSTLKGLKSGFEFVLFVELGKSSFELIIDCEDWVESISRRSFSCGSDMSISLVSFSPGGNVSSGSGSRVTPVVAESLSNGVSTSGTPLREKVEVISVVAELGRTKVVAIGIIHHVVRYVR